MVSGESTDVSITTSKEALEFGVQAMRGPEAQHTKGTNRLGWASSQQGLSVDES